MKLTGHKFGQTGEDATESSQEMDIQTLPILLEKLFQMRDSANSQES